MTGPLDDAAERKEAIDLDPIIEEREWRELARAVRLIADHAVGRETGDPSGPDPDVWARFDEQPKFYRFSGDEGFEGLDPNSSTRLRLKVLIVELQKYVASPQFLDNFKDEPMVDSSGQPVMETVEVKDREGKILSSHTRQKINLAHDQRKAWGEKHLLENQWAEQQGLPVGKKLYNFFRNSPFKVTILSSAQHLIKDVAKDLKEKGLDTSPEGRAFCELADSFGKPGGIHDFSQYEGWRDKGKAMSNMTLWDEIPAKERWDIVDELAVAFRKFLDAVPAGRDWLNLGDY